MPRSRSSCKYSPFVKSCRGGFLLFMIVFLSKENAVESFPFSFTPSQLNCSSLCTCEQREVGMIMRHNRHQHIGFMGSKFRSDLQFSSNSDYMAFLGVFGSMLKEMYEIKCDISDGQTHRLSSLLNGVEKITHTAVDIECRNAEQLIWDVPSWDVAFNVFTSENCQLMPTDPSRGIVVPMNMWIFDVHRGGADLMNVLNIKYLMNTVALCISDSFTSSIPKHWQHSYLISASMISLQYNDLETFDCSMLFSQLVDTLNLEHNEFVHFPECLLKSSEVKVYYLSLSNNLISDLSPLYDDSTGETGPDIEIINLSFNDIRELEDMKPMPKLKMLDLSHNFIKEVPDGIFQKQPQLTHLFLSHNRIHTLGFTVFSKTIGLHKIDLSYNALDNILPDQLPITQKTVEVDIRHNKLSFPPLYQCGRKTFHSRIVSFLAAGNPFFCDCTALDFEMCQNRLQTGGPNATMHVNMFEDFRDYVCAGPVELEGIPMNELRFSEECVIAHDCPSNCDCYLQNSQYLNVNCSHQQLLEMPDTIPYFPNATVILHLDHNPIQMLSFRSYLSYLSELHMDNCLISSVTPAAIAALQNVHVLTLHNNMLQKLPASTKNITLNQANNVTLFNNRWQCSCESLWLPRWISKHRGVLWAPGNIMCNYLRKPVEDFSDVDINCNSTNSYLEVLLAVCLALTSIVSTVAILIYYRTDINVLIYSKLGLRIGSTLSFNDRFSPYDAFVSYSQGNYKWVVDTLVPKLERGSKRYRLCLHYRDFPAEEPIVDNIPWAIHLSRCSILVLSNDFVKKEWCIMELRAAFQRLLLVANKLIILATEDINLDELSPDLRAYMNTHEFLRVGEANFWEKLDMLLPPARALDTGEQGQAGGDQPDNVPLVTFNGSDTQVADDSTLSQPNRNSHNSRKARYRAQDVTEASRRLF